MNHRIITSIFHIPQPSKAPARRGSWCLWRWGDQVIHWVLFDKRLSNYWEIVQCLRDRVRRRERHPRLFNDWETCLKTRGVGRSWWGAASGEAMVRIAVGLLHRLRHLQVDVDVDKAGLYHVDQDRLYKSNATFVMVGANGVSTLLCVMLRILHFQAWAKEMIVIPFRFFRRLVPHNAQLFQVHF